MVYETLSANTTDRWLYIYFIASSLAKISSAVCQGMFLVIRKYRHLSTTDENYILRLAFVNVVSFCYSLLHQVVHYGDTSWSLFADLGFRLFTSVWCFYTLCKIQLEAIIVSYVDIFQDIKEEPYCPIQESGEINDSKQHLLHLLPETEEEMRRNLLQTVYKHFVDTSGN